jgi:hypothetical protein
VSATVNPAGDPRFPQDVTEKPVGVLVVAALVFGLGALPATVAAVRARADLHSGERRTRARAHGADADTSRDKLSERRAERREAAPPPATPPAPAPRTPPRPR